MIEEVACAYIELLPDDSSVQGGIARFGAYRAMLLESSGTPSREEWLKAFKLMAIAQELQLPIVCQLDWSRASSFSGLADSEKELCSYAVPIISVQPGECCFADASVSGEKESIIQALNALEKVPVAVLQQSRQERWRALKGKDNGLANICIRPARLEDVPAMVESFKPFVLKQQILPRPAEEITARLDDFIVAVNETGRIVGTVALRSFDGGLEEIRSLTVAQDYDGRGLGTRLLKEVIKLACVRKATRLFTLTIRPHIFQRLGFFPVSLMRFPDKVQKDCLLCPKKEQCDEVALLLEV